jgi:hypothetical protein
MFIPDPDFYPSRIPDPKTVKKERGEKKFVIIIFFCSHKFHKIEYYVIFEMLKKKFGPIFKELLKFLPKNFSICSQIYGFGIRDPGKNLFRIPDPGVKKAPDPGSGSATLPAVLWICEILVRIRIRASDQWIRIVFSSLIFKKPTRDNFFFFSLFKNTFTSFFQE